MTDLSAPFTLREWRDHMTYPARVFAMGGAAVILAIMGPFETDAAMTLVPRFVYWLGVVVGTYTIGYASNLIAQHLVPDSLIRSIPTAGVMTGLGAWLLIYVLNGVLLSYWPIGQELVVLFANIMVIAMVVAGIFQIAYATAPDQAAPSPPPLLERLAFEKRGALVSISVEDHYVRVRTTDGEDMLLLRLSDAIREVGDTAGQRVHRSHWVAFDQVKAAARKGDGALLNMTHGPDIPVSRANVSAIRERGLLPR